MRSDKAELICAIEDDEDILRLIRHTCEEAGYCVVCETDGIKGLHLVKEIKPDLVLLDLMLPGMHGIDICFTLRREQSTRHIPIIILSACGEEEDVARGLDTGACDYIVKPFRRLDLLARIRRHLHNTKTYLTLREHHAQLERLQRDQSAQLKQASKLAEIGAMAAGLHHEFTNIASGLTMGLDVIQRISPEIAKWMRRPSADHNRETSQALAAFETAVAVLREDISRLLDLSSAVRHFSRSEFPAAARDSATADVTAAVKRAVRLARVKSRHTIEYDITVPPGLYVPMPQAALEQILINLLNNAVDAVLERRCTAPKHVGRIIVWAQSEKSSLTLGVADNGCGMPVEIQEKIFKEFFTTKPPEKGTGLGLAMVKRIVESVRGDITFHSSPGQGTTFAVSLPLVLMAPEVQQRDTCCSPVAI